MPELQQKTPTTSAPTVAPPEQSLPAVQQARGNEAAQAGLGTDPDKQADGGGDSGLANYEAALGNFLGGELYKAIAPHLSYEKLSGAAKKGVDGALDGLVKQLGSIDGVTLGGNETPVAQWGQGVGSATSIAGRAEDAKKKQPTELDVLSSLLKDSLDPLVDQWLEKNGKGLSESLTQWVGAHPRTVVLTALLAAAGAIIANVGIPTLKQKFGLGKGLSAEVEAKLGKIRSMALESIRAKLSYESGPLLAAVGVGHDDKGTTGTASVGYKGEGKEMKADATFDGKGLNFVGINGNMDTDAGKLSGSASKKRDEGAVAGVKLVKQDGKITDTKDFQYNAGSGIFSVGLGKLYTDNGLTVDRQTRMGSDGSSSVSQTVGYQQTEGDVTSGGYAGFAHESEKTPFGMTETDKLKFGMNYSRADLTAKLDAAFASNGNNSLSGSLTKKDGEHSYGGDFLAKTGDSKLFEVGGFYGFKSKDEFRSYLLDYRYKSDIDQSKFGLLVEQEVKGTYLRWQSAMTWGGQNTTKLDTSLQGARYINDDTALIAGARYTKDFGTGQNQLNPQIGVQYKGIPVVAEYNTQTKGVMLSITIPFGGK